jgi:hypothetical protein
MALPLSQVGAYMDVGWVRVEEYISPYLYSGRFLAKKSDGAQYFLCLFLGLLPGGFCRQNLRISPDVPYGNNLLTMLFLCC